VNLTVVQISRLSPSIRGAGFHAISPAQRRSVTLGGFSSLLAGFVKRGESSILSGLIDRKLEDTSIASAVPINARVKASKSEDVSSNPVKKEETKPKLGLIQTSQEPVPSIKLPVQLRAVKCENQLQNTETSATEPRVTRVQGGHSDPASISTKLSPQSAPPIPAGDELASNPRIAFGLRLTTRDQLPSITTPASGPEAQISSALGLKTNAAGLENDEADLRSSQISPVSFMADTNRAVLSGLVHQDDEMHLPDRSHPLCQDQPFHTNVPKLFLSPSSAQDQMAKATNAKPETETSSGGGLRLGNQVPREDPMQRSDSVLQRPVINNKPVPVPYASRPPVSNLSESLWDLGPTDPEQRDRQNASDNGGSQLPHLENTGPSAPLVQSDTIPLRICAEEQVVTPRPQPWLKPAEKWGDGGAVPNMFRSQIEPKQDVRDSRHNEARGNSKTPAPTAQLVQDQGALDKRIGKSSGDPFRATFSRAFPSWVIPSQADSSHATPWPVTPFPVTTSQALSSQRAPSLSATSELTKVANEAEINRVAQPQTARQISLKLTVEESSRVSVELNERAGKVQVAVRTADQDLARSLRADLGDLVGKLEAKGFKTEAWIPAVSHNLANVPEQSGSRSTSAGEQHSGAGMGQHQERHGQNGSNHRQQARWQAQLEKILSTEETRTKHK
jgi:hypothetical protein